MSCGSSPVQRWWPTTPRCPVSAYSGLAAAPVRRFRVIWRGSPGVDYRASPAVHSKIAPNKDYASSGSVVEAAAVEGDWVLTREGKWLPRRLPRVGRLLEEEHGGPCGPAAGAPRSPAC